MDFLDLTLSSEDELDRSSPPLRSHGINPTSSDTRTQASTGARNLPANLLAFGGGSSNSLDRRVAHTPVAGTSDSRIPSANKGKGREIESIILSSDDEDPPHKEEQPRPALHPSSQTQRFRHGLTHGSGKRHSQPDITLSSSSEPESSHQPQSQSQSRETQFPTSQQLLERSRAIARLSQAYLEGALAHAVGQQSARPPDSQRLHMASKAASRVGTKLDPASPSTIPDRNGSPASATASSASQPFNLGGRSNGKDDGTVTSEVTNTVGITSGEQHNDAVTEELLRQSKLHHEGTQVQKRQFLRDGTRSTRSRSPIRENSTRQAPSDRLSQTPDSTSTRSPASRGTTRSPIASPVTARQRDPPSDPFSAPRATSALSAREFLSPQIESPPPPAGDHHVGSSVSNDASPTRPLLASDSRCSQLQDGPTTNGVSTKVSENKSRLVRKQKTGLEETQHAQQDSSSAQTRTNLNRRDEVDLLNEEIAGFRSSLREEVRHKWDEIFGLSSRGQVTEAAELRLQVVRAKARLLVFFQASDWFSSKRREKREMKPKADKRRHGESNEERDSLGSRSHSARSTVLLSPRLENAGCLQILSPASRANQEERDESQSSIAMSLEESGALCADLEQRTTTFRPHGMLPEAFKPILERHLDLERDIVQDSQEEDQAIGNPRLSPAVIPSTPSDQYGTSPAANRQSSPPSVSSSYIQYSQMPAGQPLAAGKRTKQTARKRTSYTQYSQMPAGQSLAAGKRTKQTARKSTSYIQHSPMSGGQPLAAGKRTKQTAIKSTSFGRFLSPVDSTHFSQAPNKSHVDSEKPPRLKATARKSNRGRPFQFTDFPLSHAAAALQSGSTDGSRKRAASEALSPDMNDGSHAATLDSPADAIGQTSLANKRRATEDSEEAGPKKTRRRRRRRKRDPPPETASLVEGEASTRLEIATSKNAPTTAEAMPPFVKATHLAVDEDTFKRQQKELPSYKRQIAGPSYDISLEFPQTIQTSVYRRERQWKKAHPEGEAPLRDGYKLLFEQMIYDANSKEFPPRLQPKIRVCPPEDALATDWSSPFFEICYTNRIVYADGIVPKQAPGCDCIGNCGDPRNREGCGCRKRQIAASRTRRGGSDRSNHSDFAYNAEGLLNDSLFAHNDPIIECNSQCGCGETCINRVIGSQKATSIDIFHTGDKGWGIRNPLSFHDSLLGTYQERTIRKGEPLGVYAGELLLSQEADERDKLVYRKTQRCYTYALDPWTVGEDYRALVQKVEPSHLKVASALRSAHKTTTATSCAKKSAARKLQRMKAESIGSQTTAFGETAEDDGYSAVFSVDAFSYGNWTRFANHVCQDFNVVPRSIYIDDADITRPLWVYVALRDIPPGEEINISYFSESEPRPQDHGLKREDWRKCADKLREEMPKTFRCYCRKELCRGVMFNLPDPDNEFFFNRPT